MRIARFICVICRKRFAFKGHDGTDVREILTRLGHTASIDGVERRGRILCLSCVLQHQTPRGRLLRMWAAKARRQKKATGRH
jgi:hypothetical protein